MDSERAIRLAEKEINRLEASAKLGGFFANDHLEMALAMREVLAAYIQEPFVFREHRIRSTRTERARRKR